MTTTAGIAAPDLHDRIASGPSLQVLDVRTPAKFETAHIAIVYNAIVYNSQPLDLLREHRGEIAGHLNEQVVLVCRSGVRATQAEKARSPKPARWG